jgi:SagB-type dehydrogenase family enzyme
LSRDNGGRWLVFPGARFRLSDDLDEAQLQGFVDHGVKWPLAIENQEILAQTIVAMRKRGLTEYQFRLDESESQTLALVMLPQLSTAVPQAVRLESRSTLQLSRFAVIRRSGGELMLESPLAEFQVVDLSAKVWELLYLLETPRSISELGEHLAAQNSGDLLALLVGCGFLTSVDSPELSDERRGLPTWEFHDLLFHARSRPGRHAYPSGAHYSFGTDKSVFSKRERKYLNRVQLLPPSPNTLLSTTHLRNRRSRRAYSDQDPIKVSELSDLLYHALATDDWDSLEAHPSHDERRPYPSGGAIYEIGVYVCVRLCSGLDEGLYEYDPRSHQLLKMRDLDDAALSMLGSARAAMAQKTPPQVLLLFSSHFAGMAWKYRAIAYAVTLKNLGAIYQTIYLVAEMLRVGGCALGSGNIQTFADLIDTPFYEEGLVGEFSIGSVRDRATYG